MMKPWTSREVEVVGGVDGDDARHRLRVGGVDRRDLGVGDRRAHERDVAEPGDGEVVEVPRLAVRMRGSSDRRTGLPRIEPDVGMDSILREAAFERRQLER